MIDRKMLDDLQKAIGDINEQQTGRRDVALVDLIGGSTIPDTVKEGE